ncbi:hypothetical protein [Catenulispora pinisilvae]|uniref:hypothetical protein n=1 Tax=Catenulispora pinisilvae TaxID=2705253 RepID=UPI001892863D|nr:hypothetical protein [Catenulispora pinisilvae]
MSDTTAADLLAKLDPLDFPARKRLLAAETKRLAADAGELDAFDGLHALDGLDGLDGLPALDTVLDAFAAGGAYERELGVTMATIAGRSERLVAALNDPLHRVRALAMSACVARPGAVTDAAVLATVDDASLEWRRTLVRMVGAARRSDLADRLVESYRDSLGEADTARLLPLCTAEVAARLLPELAHELTSWSRLGIRHPRLMLEYARRELAAMPAGSREGGWAIFGAGLVAAAQEHPSQVLDLLEEFPLSQGIPDAFLRRIRILARADEDRTLRLLTVADGGLANRWWYLSRTTRKRLARSGRSEIVVIGRALQNDTSAFADLLGGLPPSARAEFYEAVTADREKDTAILAPAVLDALPRRRRHAEARRMLALPSFTDRPGQRLVYVARLPWDEARAELRAAVRRADAQERADAYPLLVACAAAEDHPPAVTALVTEELGRLRNEQDPVRRAALAALATVPARLFEDVPAVSDTLLSLVTDALEARDCGWGTRAALQQLACRILAHQATDNSSNGTNASTGTDTDTSTSTGTSTDTKTKTKTKTNTSARARTGTETSTGTGTGNSVSVSTGTSASADTSTGTGDLLTWSLLTFEQLAGATSAFHLGQLDRNLRRGQELAVYRTMRPWIERGIGRADHRLVLALAESLGRRARRIPELQDAIAHAIWHGTGSTARSAIDLWLADPAHRDVRVARVVAWDPSAAALWRVASVLSMRRTDLLDPYLSGGRAVKGRFIAQSDATWVGRFQPSHRWLPRQLAAYARLLAKVAADRGAKTHVRTGAISVLGTISGEGQREVRRYLDSPEIPLVEAALQSLAHSDDPAATLPILLAHADGDRARVAVYAAAHAARFARPSAAGPALAEVALSPTAKVTSRKEALRIAAALEIPGLVDLLEVVWRGPGRHRDVKAAVISRLTDQLDDERVPALLREAVGEDPAIAVQLLRMRPQQLPERHRRVYGDLIAAACDARDPKVSGLALAVAPRWHRWSGAVATVVCTAMTDLNRLGDRTAPPSALFALLAEGMPVSRYRAVLEALLAADAQDDRGGQDDQGGTRHHQQDGAQHHRVDGRDRPARRRLVQIAQAAAEVRGPDPIERRAIRTLTAQTLAERPGYARLAATLAASAMDLDAEVEEVAGELLELAAGLAGRPDAAVRAGEQLVAMVAIGEPWDPAAVLAAVEALAARDEPAAGLIATRLVGIAGARLDWPQGYRSVVGALRRHSDPAVVEEALDLDIGAAMV